MGYNERQKKIMNLVGTIENSISELRKHINQNPSSIYEHLKFEGVAKRYLRIVLTNNNIMIYNSSKKED